MSSIFGVIFFLLDNFLKKRTTFQNEEGSLLREGEALAEGGPLPAKSRPTSARSCTSA
jgi:hypothetical protein